MTVSAQFPTAAVSHGQVSETGDKRTLLARNVEAIAARVGILPATASTTVTAAGGTKTLYVSGGSLRTISTVAIATGMTIAIGSAGAVQGQRFVLAKIATGGTGAVTVDGHAFTTHKKFNCELMFVNGSWRMTGYYEYA